MPRLFERFALPLPASAENEEAWSLSLSRDGKPAWLLGARFEGAPREPPEMAMASVERLALGAPGLAPIVACGVESNELIMAYGLEHQRHLGALSVGEAASELALTQIAETLSYLHDCGLCHGHLRPELIQIGISTTSLAGFGFNQVLSSVAGVERARTALPVAYRAPELADAQRALDSAADIYALGVIFLEFVIGRKIESGRVEISPRACGLDLGDDVEQLLRTALATSPSGRPSDLRAFVSELLDALRRVRSLTMATAPISSPPPRPLSKTSARALEQTQVSRSTSEAPQPALVNSPPQAHLGSSDRRQSSPSSPEQSNTSHQPSFGPAKTMSHTSEHSSWLPILAMVAGSLFLVFGVAGIFAYAWLTPSPTSAVSVAPKTSIAPTVSAAPPLPPTVPSLPPSTIQPYNPVPTASGGSSFEKEKVPHVAGSGVVKRRDALLPVSEALTVGANDALVTLVMFGDLQCPHSRANLKVLNKLRKAFSRELLIVWRNRPLQKHKQAMSAARVLFGVQRDLGAAAAFQFLAHAGEASETPTRSVLEGWVKLAGGRAAQMGSWLSSQDTLAGVHRDMQQAGIFRVLATPTFFVNGARLEGEQSFRALETKVTTELNKARALLGSGVPRQQIYSARVRKNLIGVGQEIVSRSCPAVGDSPVRGAHDALVTIVEFSDFECPFCARVQPTLEAVLARYSGDVRFVWKNYPLSFHKRAKPAAEFALEVLAQGGTAKFWQAHDQLFASQHDLSEKTMEELARKLGLDELKTLEAVRTRKNRSLVEADIKLGKLHGVGGTPSFFVNGRMLSGARPKAEFMRVVGEEVAWAKRLMASGTPRHRVGDQICGRRQ